MAKQDSNRKRALILYWLYGVVFAGLLIYLMFPSVEVARHLQSSVEKAFPAISLRIDKVTPYIGPGIALKEVTLLHKDNSGAVLGKFERILISPALWALVRGDRYFDIRAEGFKGTIKATVNILEKEGKRGFQTDTEMEAIRLEELKVLSNLAGRKIEGVLNGSIFLIFSISNPISANGRARLRLAGCTIELLQPIMGFSELAFGEVTLNANLEKRRINLSQADFKGRELNGFVSGFIDLTAPFYDSGLELKGVIEPHAALFSGPDVRPDTKVLMMQFLKKGKINFTVRGTMRNPTVRFM